MNIKNPLATYVRIETLRRELRWAHAKFILMQRRPKAVWEKKSCYTTGLSKGNCIVVCELKEDNKSAAIMHRILAWEKGFSLSPFLFSPSPLGSNMRDMTMGCVQDTFLDAQFQIFYFTLFFCWQTKVSRRNAWYEIRIIRLPDGGKKRTGFVWWDSKGSKPSRRLLVPIGREVGLGHFDMNKFIFILRLFLAEICLLFLFLPT